MVFVNKLLYNVNSFRTSFQLQNKSVLHWFPGHMGKGIKDMQKKLKSVDCVIEVHDARIPFSGRNPDAFQTISGLRPHILVYNKRDLADERLEAEVVKKNKENGVENIIFTNCKKRNCSGVNRLIPVVQKLVSSSSRHNRSENQDKCLMVIGVPNVGKSSLINVLRHKYMMKSSAAQVGAAPGITRNVGNKIKVSDDPLIYVYDTPGILTPKVPSVDDGMKLALCATIPDKEVGTELVADYLLYWMNKHRHFQYVNYLDCGSPSDNISEVLVHFAVQKNFYMKIKDIEGNYVRRPNILLAASDFIDAFRRGVFGPVTLDIDKLNLSEKSRTFVTRRSIP